MENDSVNLLDVNNSSKCEIISKNDASPKTKENDNNGKVKTKYKKHKKHRRKASDTVVKDITQIMSNFIIISPKKSVKTDVQVCVVTEDKAEDEDEKEETTINNSPSTPKVNAFAFMMNNRQKVIGTNSPGKELTPKLSPSPKQEKNVKSARKKLLQDWAEVKGASKRKRDYEETGNCIIDKLDKRAKKLKEMLNVNETQSDDEVINKKKRKCQIIESDTESSRDSFTNEKNTKKRGKKKVKRLSRLSLKQDCQITDALELAAILPNTVKHYKNIISEKMAKNDELKNEENPISNGVLITDEKCKENDLIATENKAEVDILEIENNNHVCSIPEEQQVNKRVLRERRAKPKSFEDFLDEEEIQKELERPKSKRKSSKVAPIFLKSIPKPKLDPEVIEARRQFLLSSIPTSLKKEFAKEPSVEETELDVFPTISHVNQLHESYFKPPLPQLALNKDFEIDFKSILLKPFQNQINKNTPKPEVCRLDKIVKFKKIVMDLKLQNPNYPVLRAFNFIYGKSGLKTTRKEIVQTATTTSATKKRGRPRKNQPTTPEQQTVIIKSVENENLIYSMWTEKYKPSVSSDIIGNCKSIANLRNWLKNWSNAKQELRKLKKRSDSSSDFELTDGDSRDSVKMYSNSVILTGPCGTGKSTAVYAICNELGFSVLEVNASSKRTGKWLFQELQEATQSHQVRKTDKHSFVKEEKKGQLQPITKMCVLLIEDIDIVFEQDEGFLSALSQIMTTSKRPFILTTTDPSSPIIQKFISHYEIIKFTRLPPSILSIWLQIVCLVEGIFVDQSAIQEFMDLNRGDVRKTLLQLQFWVCSGGQINKDENNLNSVTQKLENTCNNEIVLGEDDNSNLSDLKLDDAENNEEKVVVHFDCVSSFEIIQKYTLFQMPCDLNSDIIWWNIPNLFNQQQESKETINKQKEREKLQSIARFYTDLSLVDVLNKKTASLNTNSLKDSLELEHSMTDNAFYQDRELVNELGQRLLSGGVQDYKKFEKFPSTLNMAAPTFSQQRILSKRNLCDDVLKEAISRSCISDRKAVTLDYLPILRNIARSENERALNNSKRGNRFHNCLKSFGVHCGESTYNLLSEVFPIQQNYN